MMEKHRLIMSPEALHRISIRGFRSIASIEDLALRPLNVLIGANGAGKSNFIGAFSFLCAIREGRLQDYVTVAGGAERVLHFGSKTTGVMSFDLSFEEPSVNYVLKLSPTDDDGLFPSTEIALVSNPNFSTPITIPFQPRPKRREAGISADQPDAVAKSLAECVGNWRVYHVHDTSSTSLMRKTAKLHDNRFLRSDGSNLAAFLFFLFEKHPDSYRLIQKTVQQVAPFFDDFRLEPLLLRPDSIKLEWRHKDSDQYFDAAALSDGTLRFMALATLFLQPKILHPQIILVDEPELGLHPFAITLLASLIQEASVETQVIVSTQSSLLLDHLKPEDVLVAERQGGSTQIRRLDSERLKEWLDEYSLGELWEKNELGGRPGSE